MRLWFRSTTWIVAVVLTLMASAAQAVDMYAGVSPSTPSSGPLPGSLLRIDDTTGAVVDLGSVIDPRGISGVAIDSAGRLFGSTRPGGSSLIELDPANGSLITSHAIFAGADAIGIGDLAVQPGTDLLFGVGTIGNPCSVGGQQAFCLYIIDKATGSATLIGPLVDASNSVYANGGIAFHPDGTLYLVESGNNPSLSVVDPNTAIVQSSVPLLFAPDEPETGTAPLDGLAVRPDDGLLLATGPAGVQEVLSVGYDGQVRFFLLSVGAKITDLAFPPDICPGGDDDVDTDGDGVPDDCDVCPGSDDAIDTDEDGVPDGCDVCSMGDDNVDTDGDGVPNACDICEGGSDAADADGDETPDACDICAGSDDTLDGDGDGVPDGCDLCLAGDDQIDTDADGVPDACDACEGAADNLDSDADGIPDECDVCPTGDDGLDDDGDGVPDACDMCPGGDDDIDTDEDGVPDFCDVCPMDGDNDADGDGVCGDLDMCPGGDDNVDADGDGTADFCDVCPLDPVNDADGDGICADMDNCPAVANPGQADMDGDGIGDACEADTDGDGVVDDVDNCPNDPNSDQADTDGDGIGDACEDTGIDEDGDGVLDADDVCPGTPFGQVVDDDGCSIDQICPCEHAVGGDKWKNHGSYVSCVAHTSNDFVELGLISEAEKDAIVSAAGGSSCGHKNK